MNTKFSFRIVNSVMTKAFIKIFLAICFLAATTAAQDALPVNTDTKAITDLKTLLPAAENRKPLLINFWATWCGPCYSEFPELVKIDGDYRKKGLNFVVVSVDNVALIDTKVPEFLSQFNSTMPSYLLYVPGGRSALAKAVRGLTPKFPDVYPLTLLFDANGKLIYQKLGRIDQKILRAQIEKVLNKK